MVRESAVYQNTIKVFSQLCNISKWSGYYVFGEEQPTRGTHGRFPTWENKKIWKSQLLELKNHGIALASSVMTTNAPFLHFNDFSIAQRFLLPTSFLTAVRTFHIGFLSPIFSLPLRQNRRYAWMGFLTLNFSSVLLLAVALPAPAHNYLNPDWMPMSFCYDKRWNPEFGERTIGAPGSSCARVPS